LDLYTERVPFIQPFSRDCSMSLLSSSELPATVTPDRKNSSALVEKAVAFGFLTTVGIAMTGWLYALATAVWDCASWLLF
jgi:hypothetical protein